MIPGMMERTAPTRRGGLPDAALAGAILGELRQAVLMYMEAALEATAPDVRRLFERLGYDAARKHELLASMMRQHGLLEPGFPAPAPEVQRAASRAAEAAQAASQRAREPQAMHRAAPQPMTQQQMRPAQPQGMHQAAPQAMLQGQQQGMHQVSPQAMPQGMHQVSAQVMHQAPPQAMPPQFAGAPMRPAHVYAPPEPPRYAGYGPPPMGAQPQQGAQPHGGGGGQPAHRAPEFAQPHAMPFGGLPTAAYVPPQPQQQARPQGPQHSGALHTGAPQAAMQPEQASRPPATAHSYAQPQHAGAPYAAAPHAGANAGGAKGAAEAPPPMRDAEPAESAALREEASLQPQADAAEAAPPASVSAEPATKRPRRSKAAAAADTQAADTDDGGEPVQLTT